MLGGGGCVFVIVDLEARHHLIYDVFGVVEVQFVNCSVGFPELKVNFLEVVFEVIPCFVRQIGEFPRPDVVFKNSLFVEDNEGKVYCLTLVYFRLGHSCLFDQVVDEVEDKVNWLGRIVGNLFDNSFLVLAFLQGNAPLFILQELE